MRKQIGHIVKAHAGDSVRFDIEIPEGVLNADCALFSAVKGCDPAPHVPPHKATHLDKGRPLFTNPVVLRLRDDRPIGDITTTVDEKCVMCIMQDVDSHKDALAHVRIFKNGKRYPNIGKRLLSTVGRTLGGWQGALCGRNANSQRNRR